MLINPTHFDAFPSINPIFLSPHSKIPASLREKGEGVYGRALPIEFYICGGIDDFK
jgi:hypothetical protein